MGIRSRDVVSKRVISYVLIAGLFLSVALLYGVNRKQKTAHFEQAQTLKPSVSSDLKEYEQLKTASRKKLTKAVAVESSSSRPAKTVGAVLKNEKQAQRKIARVRVYKRGGPNAHLGMDSWQSDHEQVETLREYVPADPFGADAFEKKRLKEEITAAGL